MRRTDAAFRDEQVGTGTAILTVVAVGVAMLVFLSTGADIGTGSLLVAWSAYGLYLATLLVDSSSRFPALRRQGPQRAMIGILVVTGVTLRLAIPPFDWLAVLFVITAAGATFVLPMGQVAGIIVAQTVVAATGSALAGNDTFSVVFTSTIYLMFQVFAALMVRTAIREVRARRALAASNAELSAATTMLAASSRNTERLRIARDLHDVVGHQLTALALELEIAGHHVDGAAAEHVERARIITKDLLTDIRGVVGELRDASHGLDATLRPMLGRLPSVAVDLTVDEQRTVDDTRALAVVRLVQEVATNTLRHASADRLTVRVTSDEAGVRVEARDNGTGASRWQMGNGLTGMEERFADLGGTVAIDPGPSRGFGVEAWLPAT